jgi:arsenite-transporting ATPase
MVDFPMTQLTLISGKGGVGKTTSACAIALTQAQASPDTQLLLLSTDPAHSLGDVLGITVDDTARSHPDCPNLKLRALDADRLLRHFRSDYGQVLETLVERGSFVDDDDLSPVWDMDWPGLNELMGLLEIQRILRVGEADQVVVDMAPSGHTLNLLGLMDFLDTFLAALSLFQDKHRYMMETLSGRYTEDAGDRFLADMKRDLATGRAQLQDPDRTACWVVALPEPLSLKETERFTAALGDLGIPLGGILVNRLTGVAAEGLQLTGFGDIAGQRPVLGLPRRAAEPIGAAALTDLWQHLAPIAHWRGAAVDRSECPWPDPIPPGLDDFIAAGRRLVIVGGKGGVGKTTVAAAIATAMAQHYPQQTVRVISIDPAHSLGDAFEAGLGHAPVALTANLSAQEVDAETMLDQFRQDYLWELADMMGGNEDLGGLQVAYGPEGWRQIVTQALPGIDEMLALITVMDLLDQDDATLVVLDTAPTGHLLSFLAMPTALGDWLAWIFKLWMKYQDVVGRVELMGRLRGLRKQVMQAQKRLTDGDYTEFLGVVQAQSAIVAEAQRLSQTLVEQGMAQRTIVLNRYEPGQDLPDDAFPNQTVVRLPALPTTAHPHRQVKAAAHLLFPQQP